MGLAALPGIRCGRGRRFICRKFPQTTLFSGSSKLSGTPPSQNWGPAQEPARFVGQVEVVQFSRQQYTWHDDGPNGHPVRSLPPAHSTREASSIYELPPYSLTVLRGRVPD